jgi:hypothetical protein
MEATIGSIMFPFGVRLSTELAAFAFVLFALARRDWSPLLAGWAWLSGFELAYQLTRMAGVGGQLRFGPDGPIFYIVLGAISVTWLTWYGVRPWLPLMVLVAAGWALWIIFGFQPGYSSTGEALNESVKTLWALAYFAPLVRGRVAQAGVCGNFCASVESPLRRGLDNSSA